MFRCSELPALTEGADPRVRSHAFRCLPGGPDGGTLLLVGVVHDHPASVNRVATVLDRLSPDILALELPPLAIPLFQQYASDVFVPPRLGGEMSAAIQAAGPIRTVGLDAPNLGYLGYLLRRFRAEGLSAGPLTGALRDVTLSSFHAVACGVAALLGAGTGLQVRVYDHITYDCTLLDAPEEQADHEADHVAKQRAFLGAVETPPLRRLVDETRERSMGEALRRLRSEGDVIAVVGMEHLDGLSELLDEGGRHWDEGAGR